MVYSSTNEEKPEDGIALQFVQKVEVLIEVAHTVHGGQEDNSLGKSVKDEEVQAVRHTIVEVLLCMVYRYIARALSKGSRVN